MRLLLITDTVMNEDIGGICQTLYNLFSFLSPGEILIITSEKELKAIPASKPYHDRHLTYDFEIIRYNGGRFSKYLSPLFQWFNFSFNNLFRSFEALKKQIQAFDPDVIVSCPNGPVGVFMNDKLLSESNKKSVFPYLMDDWVFHQSHLKWLGGNMDSLFKAFLTSKSWLMISQELSNIFVERYRITPENMLIVHNPVDLSNAPVGMPLVKQKHYTLAYAGALWAMHFDSFKAIAQSVAMLKNKVSVSLVIYTSSRFWEWRKIELEPLGVSYGGNIPYKDIHGKLAEADALIVCSSFKKELESHSKSSVQTKITDYLKARRLIISCGPDYSANHNFLKSHECGVCIESNDVEIIESTLKNILDHIEDYQTFVDNGWRLLEGEFTFSKVHEKLYSFLINC